jgi:hypothetical protein
LVKLQKSTWRYYTRIWKALLCFVYRTAQPDQRVLLRHQLTSRHTVNLFKVVAKGEELAQLSSCDGTFGEEATSTVEQSCDALDMHCLELCVSLLYHDLKGDLFEIAVIGFIAAIAIDPVKGILKEAYHFTPTLSGFIKIAQMLVIQKAVVGARDVESIQPADLLDEMRVRFLIKEFARASKLSLQPLSRTIDQCLVLLYPSPTKDRQYKDFDFNEHATSNPVDSPYGDNARWDLLRLGHCDCRSPRASDLNMPLGRAMISDDQIVPAHQHLDVEYRNDGHLRQYLAHTRVVSRARVSTCSFAHGVSQPRAL